MAQQIIKLKKCAYRCGYFQPFSTRTVYCDQLLGKSDKSCKELTAREKYEKRIAADERLPLYQRRNDVYAMRVSRAPEYQALKKNAEDAVKQFVEGRLSLEELKPFLRLHEAE